MSFPHFLHECRVTLRENRTVSIIPVFLTLVTLLIWQAPWTGKIELAELVFRPGYKTLGGFFNQGWVYVGWLIPWWILSRPSLHDRNALWRTAPVSRTVIFGSRLLWALITTVVLPVLTAYALCLHVFPPIAVEQSLAVSWIQFTLLAVGAFAAFVAPGLRGLAYTAVLGILWYVITLFGEDACRWILHHLILPEWPKDTYNPHAAPYDIGISRTWPAEVPWVLVPIIVFIWLPFQISRPGCCTRLRTWALAVGTIAVLAQAAVFLVPYLKPSYPGMTLPPLKLAMETRNLNKPDNPWRGVAKCVLPENQLRFINTDCNQGSSAWNSETQLSGEWSCGDLSGRYAPQLLSTRMHLDAVWMTGSDGKIPFDENRVGYDNWVRPLGPTLETPGIKVWLATGAAQWSDNYDNRAATYGWVDADSAMQKPQRVEFRLKIPRIQASPNVPEKPILDQDVFAGKALRMNAKLRAYRTPPATVVCRFPVLTGGVFTTPEGETITIIPGQADDRGFLMRRTVRTIPVEMRPKRTDRLTEMRPNQPELMLYNAKEKQAVYLTYDSPRNLCVNRIEAPEKTDENFEQYPFYQYAMPQQGPKLSPEWYENAEFVVLRYNDTPVTLPVEITLDLPKTKTP